MTPFDAARGPAAHGLHFLIGLQPGAELTPHDRGLLRALRPAGIVLFHDNFLHDEPYARWLAALRALLDDVRANIGRPQVLIAIDHEGGAVHRTPHPITRFPAAARWGRSAGPVGRAMGVELRSIGCNLSFGPVLDVGSNPQNPVIGERAFGPTPEVVRRGALAFLDALEAEGVLACGKHFPGHGDTTVDSHRELPCVQVAESTLRRRELPPFVAAVRHGVRALMTAHVLYPGIDPQAPATLSRPLLGGILRGELGFDGVVVSDDLGMAAVSRLFERPETVVQALAAGCDLLLLCDHLTDAARALEMARHLEAAVAAGALDTGLLAASANRIERLLEAAPRHPVEALPARVLRRHARLAAKLEGAGPGDRP